MIFNTFSITVAQRMSEFGMLRTLGASRGQIMRRLSLRPVDRILGAIAGLAIGFGLAPSLDGLFEAFGVDLRTTGRC